MVKFKAVHPTIGFSVENTGSLLTMLRVTSVLIFAIQFELVRIVSQISTLFLSKVPRWTHNLIMGSLMSGLAVVVTAVSLVGCAVGSPSAAKTPEATVLPKETPVVVSFFYSSACTSCAFTQESRIEADQARRSEQARSMLEDLSQQCPQLEVASFEVTYHPENREHLESVAGSLGQDHPSVPMVFIGTRYWTVYGEETRQEIQAYVQVLLDNSCFTNNTVAPAEAQ